VGKWGVETRGRRVGGDKKRCISIEKTREGNCGPGIGRVPGNLQTIRTENADALVLRALALVTVGAEGPNTQGLLFACSHSLLLEAEDYNSC
jgi:hypothetical protein